MHAKWTFMSVLSVGIACGGSNTAVPVGDNTPYTSDPNKTVVLGAGGAAGVTAAQTSSSGCVMVPGGTCVEAKACAADERRDVVVDSTGKVVSVVCYPADATPTVVNSQGNVTLDKNHNNGVVAVGSTAGSVGIVGDVTANGNNVTVYGHGGAGSIIGGNVTAGGNNFAMRGVTVKGNVEVNGNNASLVLCVVLGNVHVVGNNNVIADCDILGDVEIDGVNNVLVGNHIGGTIKFSESKNQVCDGNTKWSDADADKIFQAAEVGAALTCGK